MTKIKYFSISIPFIIIGIILYFNNLKNPTRPSRKPRLHPQVVGKWVVGEHPKFNDADTLNLQEAIDHALNGDTILVRPGQYEIQSLPKLNLAIRGLSGTPEDIHISLQNPLLINGANVKLENLFLTNHLKMKSAISITNGELLTDNIKVKFTNTKQDFYVAKNGRFRSLNNHFIGMNKNTSIFLTENAELHAEGNKFIKFKNAIESDHNKFLGIINLKDIEISHCLSSAIYLHGGRFSSKNISISKSASGFIISGNSVANIDQIYISNNKFFALDIIDGGKINIDLFKFENNRSAGIRVTGKESELNVLNGEISSSQSGLIVEDGASVNGKNIKLGDNLTTPIVNKESGEINLIN